MPTPGDGVSHEESPPEGLVSHEDSHRPRVIQAADAPSPEPMAQGGADVAFREVTMVEIREVLRLWRAGRGKKPIARQLRLDPKTVHRYSRAAEAVGSGSRVRTKLGGIWCRTNTPPEHSGLSLAMLEREE